MGAVCLSESLANKALVAGELATNAMGLSGVLAQARDAVLLVRLEVALEPIPVTRIFIRALPRQDMRGDAVEEHAVVADDHGATGELKQPDSREDRVSTSKSLEARPKAAGCHPA